METKATSLRLPVELAAELAAVARVEELPISEIVRAAISQLIAARRSHPAFKERLKECLEEDRKTLERLVQ